MRKILFISILFFLVNSAKSQEFLGIRQSNYSGVMGLDYNPASIADNRMKVDVLLFGAYVSVYNNHAYFNPKFMPSGWTGLLTNDPKTKAWMEDTTLQQFVSADSINYFPHSQYLEYADGKKTRSAFVQTEIDVLNFMISINQKRSIGFQIKNRTFFNIDNATPELIRLSTNNWNYQQLFDLSLKDQNLNISMNTWNEYNFAYAQVLKDDSKHFWKIGGKLKLLQGIGSFYFNSENIDYSIKNDTTANFLTADFDYGYSENLGGYIEPTYAGSNYPSFSGGELLKKYSNLGFGGDIGVVYEFRPDYNKYKYDMDGKTDLWRKDQNKYKLRVGAAINDIGGMSYKKGSLSRNFRLQTGLFDLQEFDGVKGFRSLDSTLIRLSNSGAVAFRSDEGSFFMNLPTHANIDVDYNIWKNFYVNYYMRVNLLVFNDKNAVHYPTNYAITLRFDQKWLGISIPFSYNDVTNFRYGLGLRMGPLVIGTGDIAPIIAPGKDIKINGADIYFALKIPILNPKPKDRDKDKVSDRKDKCKNVYGVWAFKGCPDTDNDGIQDTEDACPLDSGILAFKGCPDTDGDSIMDKLDSCVTIPGLAKFNGCPDTDGDGIMDKEDDCPETPGLIEFKGCPDTDGDGLKDSDDSCPTITGPISNKGCPLKLLNHLDDNGGILSTDSLTINKERFSFNQLPTDKTQLFELITTDENYPDFIDVDVINDSVTTTIRAIKTAGNKYEYTFVKKGAAIVLSVEEQEVLNTAFKNLEFETGKDIIKESSLPSLTELAVLLGKKMTWGLKIEGHTDNVGKAAKNLLLSKKRSEAVRNFLQQKGIDANRFTVKWFGHTKPIADNKTPEGRQKNRRVEMSVIQN